ncbi:MAG: AAA family ATPase [Planctomycetota bacterium]
MFSQLSADGVAPETLPRYPGLLDETEQLYRTAAWLVAERHAGLVPSADEFVTLMDDLHRGLIVKIYSLICEADRHWSEQERGHAVELARHVWSRTLEGAALTKAMREAAEKTQSLAWRSLVGPFRRLAPLAEFVPTLETLIVRQANLIARCDGPPAESELAAVQEITREVRRAFDANTDANGAPPDEAPPSTRSETAADGPRDEEEPPTRSLAEVLAELDALVGLNEVKNELRSVAHFLSLQQKREAAGIPATTITLHMVFVGNPGTGKTTVARLAGEALAALGVLPSGKLVETDRGGLVAEYAGQTAGRVNERVDEAIGGVLFIDEAYSMVSSQGEDAYGAEAIQTLLKRAEDDRDRLSIVLAGYPEPMDDLLESNPGLKSRFARRFTFPDYSPLELCEIFGRLLHANHYQLTLAARLRVIETLTRLHRTRDEHFGNGRTVRNVFERAIMRLADRIATLTEVTTEQLITLEESDLGPLATPLPERVRIQCPACGHATDAPPRLLAARLSCPKCNGAFVAEWAELADAT